MLTLLHAARDFVLTLARPLLIQLSTFKEASLPIKAYDYREIKDTLKPGDVFVTYKSGSIVNLFIPGYWNHSGIYIGDETVVEASVKYGVRAIDLVDFCFSKTNIVILRDESATPEQIEDLISRVKHKLGGSYDFMFEDKNERFYCSELISSSFNEMYKEYGIDFVIPCKKVWGILTVSPEDLYACDKFKVKYIVNSNLD